MPREKPRAWVLMALLTLIAGEILFLIGNDGRAEENLVRNATTPSFRELIQRIGAPEAYTLFRQEYEQAPDFSGKHFAAHEFGQALYEEEGMEGIGVCDGSFGFGCYHSFFGAAIAEHGLVAARELDAACIRLFGLGGQGCQHGIGHGLIEYLGHQRIGDALAVCADLAWTNELFGCSSGVFMEYNFPTLIDEKGARSEIRVKQAGEDYFFPCDDVTSGFRKQCILSQAEWWQRGARLEHFVMATLCSSLARDEEETICFKGIGNSAAPALYFDQDDVRGVCEQMPSRRAFLECLAGAAWAFWDEGTYRDKALQMCRGLDGPQEKFCREEADLTGAGIFSAY